MRPMATPKQIEANRRNAQRSTGPKTDEGKSRSALNALKHGLCAETFVLPNEDPDAFQARLDEWVNSDPGAADDPARRALLKRAAVADWRLDRCLRHEAAVLGERVRNAVSQADRDGYARAEEL